MPLAAKGEFALVSETLEAALDKAGQPVKRGTMAHDHHLYMLLTESAAARRDAAALERFAPRLEELAERDGHGLYGAIGRRARGVQARLAGDLGGAEAHLKQALEVFAALNTAWQSGRTWCELAEVDLARGDRAAATESFGMALRAFEALGAAPDAEKVREALEAGA